MRHFAETRIKAARLEHKMSKTKFTEAFKRYDMELTNPMWSVTAINEKGEFGISCWTHFFTKEGDTLVYRDHISRWLNKGKAGYNETIRNIGIAHEASMPVRLVMCRATHAEDAKRVTQGENAHHMPKTFFVQAGMVGTIEVWDGEHFVIRFRRVQ